MSRLSVKTRLFQTCEVFIYFIELTKENAFKRVLPFCLLIFQTFPQQHLPNAVLFGVYLRPAWSVHNSIVEQSNKPVLRDLSSAFLLDSASHGCKLLIVLTHRILGQEAGITGTECLTSLVLPWLSWCSWLSLNDSVDGACLDHFDAVGKCLGFYRVNFVRNLYLPRSKTPTYSQLYEINFFLTWK